MEVSLLKPRTGNKHSNQTNDCLLINTNNQERYNSGQNYSPLGEFLQGFGKFTHYIRLASVRIHQVPNTLWTYKCMGMSWSNKKWESWQLLDNGFKPVYTAFLHALYNPSWHDLNKVS